MNVSYKKYKPPFQNKSLEFFADKIAKKNTPQTLTTLRTCVRDCSGYPFCCL